MIALLVTVAVTVGLLLQSISVFADTKVASDASTAENSGDVLGDSDSTRYAGRIWTDKSVYSSGTNLDNVNIEAAGDDNLKVVFSALSSSQQVSGQIQVPVDVVFVIDLSGSMKDPMGWSSRIKHTIDALNTSIEKLMNMNENNRIAVVGYSSTASTLLPLDHYTKYNSRGNYFSLSDGTVSYDVVNSKSNRVKGSKYVNGGTNAQMGMYQGMNILARESSTTVEVDGETLNRVPSVILLSDGAATYSSSSESWWDPANNGDDGPGSDSYPGNGMKLMMTASYMKDAIDRNYKAEEETYKTKVYTIGMGITNLWGNERNLARVSLNPSEYLADNNDMSKAIRDAWAIYSFGRNADIQVKKNDNYTIKHPETGYDITSLNYVDHYYNADEADDVANVFDNIVGTISTSAPQIPTKVGSDPLNDGYISYTDPIGEYMEVKSVDSIIFNGTPYDVKANGNGTYVCEGVVTNPGYGENGISLSNIDIAVTTDENGNQTLKVNIPGAAIPLRVNTVEVKDGKVDSNTSNEMSPIRIVYTVGLRSTIDPDTLEGKDDAEGVSDEYIKNNTVNGKVSFYSNLYSSKTAANVDKDAAGEDSTTVGDAFVDFVPATTNPYFYIQDDIVLRDNSGKPVKEFDMNAEYSFDLSYYDGTQIKTETITRLGSELARETSGGLQGVTTDSDGNYCVAKGTPRLASLLGSKLEKTGGGETKTAGYSYYPTFVGADLETGNFRIYLGNNGVMTTDSFGNISISKTVVGYEDISDNALTVIRNKEFEFKVTLDGVESTKAFTYEVTDAEGKVVEPAAGESRLIKSGETLKLKHGQTAKIKNLPINTEYTVKETTTAGSGFTTKAGTTAETATNGAEVKGAIAAGTESTAAFVNTYSPAETKLSDAAGEFKGEKILNGRDWNADDEFVFVLGAAEGTPMPEGAASTPESTNLTVTKTVESSSAKDKEAVAFEFGDIEYDKAGEYIYNIYESKGVIKGVSYTQELYRVNVSVVDNGNGKLTASYTMTKTSEADSTTVEYIVDKASFTNTFRTDAVSTMPKGTKTYIDNSDEKPLRAGMFWFIVEETDADGKVIKEVQRVTCSEVGSISFVPIEYTQDMEGQTFYYRVREDVQAGTGLPDGGTLNGMTYDTNVYTFSVTVSIENGVVVPTLTYGAGVDPNKGIVFNNIYTPTPVTITDEAGIHGTKTMTGRDIKEGESFEFKLSAANETTAKAVTDRVVDFGIENQENIDTNNIKSATVNGFVAADTATPFNFGDTTFKKPGSYTFNINEIGGTAGGVTYDAHTCTVTVVVTDNNGTLKAEVSYNNGAGAADNSQAVFTNSYAATFDETTAVTLDGTKNLAGHALENKFFKYTVEALDGAPIGESTGTADNRAGRDDDGDGTYTGTIPNLLRNVTYTQAGKYVYLISETNDAKPGYTYDNSVYRVTVTVTDNLEGKLIASAPQIEKGLVQGDGNVEYVPADSIVFNNSYAATGKLSGSANLTVYKTLSGRDWFESDVFTFKLEAVTDATTAAIVAGNVRVDGAEEISISGTGTDTVKSASFGDIVINKAGEYLFKVTETPSMIAGISNDTNAVRYVKVTATDNHNGTLKVSSSITDSEQNASNLAYTNTYTPDATTTSITAHKVMDGREMAKDESYEFTITAAEGSPENTPMPEVATVNNNAAGDITFTGITYNKEGTYTYEIRETGGEYSGVTNSTAVVTAVVTVEYDNESGTFKTPTVTHSGGDKDENTFVNTYVPEGTDNTAAPLTVTKDLEGRDWADADEFTFELKAADDTAAAVESKDVELPEKTQVSVTKDSKDYSATFGNITFKKEGTYNFEISEIDPGYANMASDTHTAKVTYKVTDNKQGNLVVDATSVSYEGDMTFTNVYTPSAVTAEISARKEMEGRDLGQFEHYKFTISAAEGSPENTPMPAEKTVENDGATITFENITYTEAGTYTYEIRETGGDYPGVTNSDAVITVVAEVEYDRATGTLSEPKFTWSGGATEYKDTFVNVYKPSEVDSAAVPLTVTKELTGRDWTETDTFTFELKAVGDTAAAVGTDVILPAETQVSVTKDSEIYSATFGNITFKKAGTYNFEISEADPGYTNMESDKHTVKVTYVVKDDQQNGKLVVDTEATKIDGSMTFTNVYTPDAATTNITAHKVMQGREMAEDESYEFTISAAEGTPMPEVETVKNNAVGDIEFTDIAYDQAGIYTYEIRETGGEYSGVTNSTAVVTAVVTVEYDSASGTFKTPTVAYSGGDIDNNTFVNVYGAKETDSSSVPLTVTKELTGRDWTETDTFTFELKAVGDTAAAVGTDVILPAETQISVTKDSENYSATFGKITFKKIGTYNFEISEINPNYANMASDKHTVKVTYKVDDNLSGNLVVDTQATTIAGSTTFTNTYTPSPVTVALEASKAVDGRQMRDDDVFEFTLSKAAGSPEDTPMPAEATVKNDGSSIEFSAMSFTKAGSYTYEIRETGGSAAGVTNSSAVVTAVVNVAYDSAAGKLVPTVTYSGGDRDNNTFVNVYRAQSSDPISFTAKKIVNSSEGNSYELKAGDFSFEIGQISSNPDSDPITGVENVVKNAADGSIVLADNVVYTEPGTYKYVVSEKFEWKPGMSYDNAVYAIIVTVTDNQNTGKLEASVHLERNGEPASEITFVNSYDPEKVSVTIGGNKNLTGKELTDGEFTFKLSGVSAKVSEEAKDNKQSETKPEATPTPEATPEVTPTPETTPETAPEATPEATPTPEMTPETTPETTPEVTPETTPETDVQSQSEQTGEPETTVENTDSAQSSPAAETAETLSANTSGRSAGTAILLTAVNNAGQQSRVVDGIVPMPEAGKETATNIAGIFRFGEITYTSPGVYTYQVSEVNGGAEGYTYDSKVYTVVVTVTDKDGKLVADVTGADDIMFNNSYKANPVSAAFSGTKVLNGRELAEGEFTFKLYEGENEIDSAVNNADGSFGFKEIKFTEEGTYRYTIVEDSGSAPAGGVTYDTTSYAVVVNVTDAGGHLVAEVTYPDAENGVVFTNEYKAKATEVQLGAAKKLDGREIKDGEFAFTLTDESGNVVSEAKNDANGAIAFDKLTFDSVGTYTYKIAEVKGSDEEIKYDENVYSVTITVTDNGEGNLEAAVEYQNGEMPEFKNVYTAKETPTPTPTVKPTTKPTVKPTVKPTTKPVNTGKTSTTTSAATGDQTDISVFVIIIIAAAAVIVIAAVVSKRRKK